MANKASRTSKETKRAALYASACIDDQDGEHQIDELAAFAKEQSYQVINTFRDVVKPRAERDKVLELVKRREIDVVLVTGLTRWASSTVDLISSLQELQLYDVSVVTHLGEGFDLTDEKIAKALKLIENFGRTSMGERTKFGMAVSGKKPGPKKTTASTSQRIRSEVRKLIGRGVPIRTIAKSLKMSPTTVQKIKNDITSRAKLSPPTPADDYL